MQRIVRPLSINVLNIISMTKLSKHEKELAKKMAEVQIAKNEFLEILENNFSILEQNRILKFLIFENNNSPAYYLKNFKC